MTRANAKKLRLWMYRNAVTNGELGKAINKSLEWVVRIKQGQVNLKADTALRIEIMTNGEVPFADWVEIPKKDLKALAIFHKPRWDEATLARRRRIKFLRNS